MLGKIIYFCVECSFKYLQLWNVHAQVYQFCWSFSVSAGNGNCSLTTLLLTPLSLLTIVSATFTEYSLLSRLTNSSITLPDTSSLNFPTTLPPFYWWASTRVDWSDSLLVSKWDMFCSISLYKSINESVSVWRSFNLSTPYLGSMTS